MTKEQIRKLKSVATQLNKLEKLLNKAARAAAYIAPSDEEDYDFDDLVNSMIDEDAQSDSDEFDDLVDSMIDDEQQAELDAIRTSVIPDNFDNDEDYQYESDEEELMQEALMENNEEFFDDERAAVNSTLNSIVENGATEEKYTEYYKDEFSVVSDDADRAKYNRALEPYAIALLKEAVRLTVKLAKWNCPVDTGSLRDQIYGLVFEDKLEACVVAGIGQYYPNRKPINYALFVHEGTRRMGGRQFLLDAAESTAKTINSISTKIDVGVKMEYDLDATPNSHVIIAWIYIAGKGYGTVDRGYDIIDFEYE